MVLFRNFLKHIVRKQYHNNVLTTDSLFSHRRLQCQRLLNISAESFVRYRPLYNVTNITCLPANFEIFRRVANQVCCRVRPLWVWQGHRLHYLSRETVFCLLISFTVNAANDTADSKQSSHIDHLIGALPTILVHHNSVSRSSSWILRLEDVYVCCVLQRRAYCFRLFLRMDGLGTLAEKGWYRRRCSMRYVGLLTSSLRYRCRRRGKMFSRINLWAAFIAMSDWKFVGETAMTFICFCASKTGFS